MDKKELPCKLSRTAVCFVRHPTAHISDTWDVVRLQRQLEGPGTWSHLFPNALQVLFHTAGRLYLLESLLSMRLLICIWMASLIPLSNHFGSTFKILILSNLVLQSG